jgi:purine catabolism regulator
MFGPYVWPHRRKAPLLTVGDIVDFPGLRLRVVAGADRIANEVSWLHVSELADPTEFLEGGEFLLTTGLGLEDSAEAQRAYVRRLADHGLAGLGFGIGLGYAEPPAALLAEADRRGFPIVTVPYEVPFVAITKAALAHLANDQLEQLTEALAVHERLAAAVLGGADVDALLEIVCRHLDCSLRLTDDAGRVVAERHAGPPLSFEGGLTLPVDVDGEAAALSAARAAAPFGEYDRLVLHHGRTALAFELSRRRAVSAAELRLAGDLLDDLERGRLDDREAERRLAAFGLEPSQPYAAVLVLAQNGASSERLRRQVAEQLDRRAIQHIGTTRRDRAAFLVGADSEHEVQALARAVAEREPTARVGIGRPARGHELGRSLLEARAALEAVRTPVASYRDLGSLELLLGLPDAALRAFVDRVLGATARDASLVASLTALLETGCRWGEAAERLGVHRHTLRYRMEKLRDQSGRHPDNPDERMELWLAVKANQALLARASRSAA